MQVNSRRLAVRPALSGLTGVTVPLDFGVRSGKSKHDYGQSNYIRRLPLRLHPRLGRSRSTGLKRDVKHRDFLLQSCIDEFDMISTWGTFAGPTNWNATTGGFLTALDAAGGPSSDFLACKLSTSSSASGPWILFLIANSPPITYPIPASTSAGDSINVTSCVKTKLAVTPPARPF